MKGHYIPQFEQRYWSADKKHVFLYDRKRRIFREPKIREVGFHGDYYHFSLPDGSQSDEMEGWFSTEIEGPAKELIDKLARGEPLSSEAERARFTYYLLARWFRVPSVEQRLQLALEQMLKTSAVIMTEDPERFRATLAGTPVESYSDEEIALVRSAMSHPDVSLRVDRNTTLMLMCDLIEKSKDELWGKSWTFVRPAPNTEFILTDNPVNVIRSAEGPGWIPRGPLSPFVQTFTPLTPYLGVIIKPGGPSMAYKSLTEVGVRHMNQTMAIGSQRYVIGHSEHYLKAFVAETQLVDEPIKRQEVKSVVFRSPMGTLAAFYPN